MIVNLVTDNLPIAEEWAAWLEGWAEGSGMSENVIGNVKKLRVALRDIRRGVEGR